MIKLITCLLAAWTVSMNIVMCLHTLSSFEYSIQAGGLAGLTGDVILFPLDTIKTRLQSKQGFLKAGGFKNIYAGLLPAAAGSVPSGENVH